MKQIFDLLGIHAPSIIGLYVAYRMFYSKTWLFLLVLLIVIDYISNIFLKNVIREPRPESNMFKDTPTQYYGMPSGHAQFYASIITWYWLFLKKHSFMEWGPIIALFFITVAERWVNKKHTIQQLVVGTILGILISVLLWNYTIKRKLS